jgi:hypothetical protein
VLLLLFLSPSPHLLVVSSMLDLCSRERDRSTFPSHLSSHPAKPCLADTSLTPLYRLLLLYLSYQSNFPNLLPPRQAASFCCLRVFPRHHRIASPPDTWHLLVRLQQSLLLSPSIPIRNRPQRQPRRRPWHIAANHAAPAPLSAPFPQSLQVQRLHHHYLQQHRSLHSARK